MRKELFELFLRNCDLRGSVVLKTEGTTLKHLEAVALTRVTINVHRHDCQRKLSCILHLKTLPDGKQRLSGAQTCERQALLLILTNNDSLIRARSSRMSCSQTAFKHCSYHHDIPLELTEER